MISLANGNRHSVTGWWQPQMPLTEAREEVAVGKLSVRCTETT